MREELSRRVALDSELLRCLHTRRYDVKSSAVLLERHLRCIRWMDTLSVEDFANVKVTAPPTAAACSWDGMGPEQAMQVQGDAGFSMLPVRDKSGASVIFIKVAQLLDGIAKHSLRAVMIATIQGM